MQKCRGNGILVSGRRRTADPPDAVLTRNLAALLVISLQLATRRNDMTNPNQESPLRANRRSLMKYGTAGVLGCSLPQMLAVEALAAKSPQSGRARNVLVVLEQGGLSHTDTWDPKPNVVSEHRSPQSPISTVVPGMQFTNLLPNTARIADRLSVIRSMYHPKSGANGHPKGTQYALSGRHPGGPIEMPDIGSVVAMLTGTDCSYLPPYIMVPGNDEQAKEARTGFLSESTKVFKTGGSDVSAADWTVKDLLPRGENSGDRFAARRQLLQSIDGSFLPTNQDSLRSVDGMDRFYEQAFDALSNTQVSAAFDLDSEPANVREQYGAGHRGACYLVGRKLIEVGVRFVTVDVRWPRTNEYPGGTNLNWDHHDFIYTSGTCNLPGAGGGGRGRYGIGTWPMMRSTDQAFAALITDMEDRGLLDETLVCFVTEFGRTPKINRAKGRDHWTNAYSIAMAGAGVPGGQVIGSSDQDGGYVSEAPYTPEDYASTIYAKLGIDRDRPIYTPANRPVYFGHAGEPIAEVF